MRCFPYECKALKRTETDFWVQRRNRMVWAVEGRERTKGDGWESVCERVHMHTHTHTPICTLRTSPIINEILEMRAYQAGINHWGLLSRRMAPCGDKRQADVWGGLRGEEERRRRVERMKRESGEGWEESIEYWWGKAWICRINSIWLYLNWVNFLCILWTGLNPDVDWLNWAELEWNLLSLIWHHGSNKLSNKSKY